MTNNITVIKRDQTSEQLDLEKMHKVVFYACEGITGVSPSEVEIKSHISFYNGIETAKVQETLIKAAADLISEETPNYQWVAGRLINYHLRKEVYGKFEPCSLDEIARRNVELGYYDENFFAVYNPEEVFQLDHYIKHDRDENIAFAGMEQFRGKYLVQNRVTGEIYETPQIAYMMIAATLFADYPKKTRMKYVKDFYDAISNFDISLPTPIMAGLRTPQRQFSLVVVFLLKQMTV